MSTHPVQVTHPEVPVKKRRRVFMWVFLAIQALFLVWIVTGATSTPTVDPSLQDAARETGSSR